MSFTLALLITAALALVAVAAHGWWTTRRSQPKQAQAQAQTQRPDAPPPVLPPQAQQERIEPTLGALSPPAEDAMAPRAAPTLPARRLVPRIDPLIDAVATLALEHPMSAEAVVSHLPASRRAGGKLLLVEGLRADDGQWEPVGSGSGVANGSVAQYSELQASVQMANRAGAINEIEYSEFVQKVQALADALQASPDFPEMLDVVQRARELDHFASQHDATLSAHLVAKGADWSVGYLRQCAERVGFLPGALAGRMVLPGAEDGAPPVLVLAFDPQAALSDDPQLASVRRLTLSLDLAQTPETPETPEPMEPFAAWQHAIRELAATMDADVVDEQGRPITLHHYAAIHEGVKKLYAALAERDMAAGSAVARRLFQ